MLQAAVEADLADYIEGGESGADLHLSFEGFGNCSPQRSVLAQCLGSASACINKTCIPYAEISSACYCRWTTHGSVYQECLFGALLLYAPFYRTMCIGQTQMTNEDVPPSSP